MITLIKSRNLVNLIFSFDKYSFVIKITIDVRRALEPVNYIPMLRITNDIVEVFIALLDPNQISVKFNNTHLLYKFFYFLL